VEIAEGGIPVELYRRFLSEAGIPMRSASPTASDLRLFVQPTREGAVHVVGSFDETGNLREAKIETKAGEVEVRARSGYPAMVAATDAGAITALVADGSASFRGKLLDGDGLVGVTIHLAVDDADRWWKRALDAGCTMEMPIGDQFWGDRYGAVRDPFGHSWGIGSPIRK